MQRALVRCDETDRRREKQEAYNEENGIEPRSVIRAINDSLATILKADYQDRTDEDTVSQLDFANQEELEPTSTNWNSTCAKPPRSSSSRKPRN